MHPIQEKLLEMAKRKQLSDMTLRAIGAKIGKNIHPNTVRYHLKQLKGKNLLSANRTLQSQSNVRETSRIVNVPVLGMVTAGPAAAYAEEICEGYLKISTSLLKRNGKYFAVEIDGDSMNNAEIEGVALENGNFAVIDANQRIPEEGWIVVSVIDGLANIKRFHKDSRAQQIQLRSDSKTRKSFFPIVLSMEDIEEGYMISGRVVLVIEKNRKYNST